MLYIKKLINTIFHLGKNNKKDNKSRKSDYPDYYLIDESEKLEIKNRLQDFKFIKKDELLKMIDFKMESIDTFLLLQNKLNYISKVNDIQEEIIDKLIHFIDTYDDNLKNKILFNYQEINYFSLSSIIINDVINCLKDLFDDYYHHRYNKKYYNENILLIKNRILPLANVYKKEINIYKKKNKFKYKDHYNLLNNRDIYDDIIAFCEFLVSKVNQRIVDMRKDNGHFEINKIINHFHDLELSINVIGKSNHLLKSKKIKDVEIYLNEIYNEFLSDSLVGFNDTELSEKTKLSILYNNLNYLYCQIKRKVFLRFENINYSFDDLYKNIINISNGIGDILMEKYHYNLNDLDAFKIVCNEINNKKV